DRDLFDLTDSYHVAIAKREDAGFITRDEAVAAHHRANEALHTALVRRQSQRQAELNAEEQQARADASLRLLATSLGTSLRYEPSQTTFYNFGGSPTIACTRWNNVVNCN